MDKKDDFVTVSVRIKPPQNPETASSLEVINEQPPVLLALEKAQTYHFDNIFNVESDQEEVFNETVKPLVENVKCGYNCTVFAYGQTGTGKTYTIGTDPEDLSERDTGLISRTIDDFFNFSDEEQEIEIFISFIEIYNEKVFDLLNVASKTPLPVKGLNVQGIIRAKIYSTYDAKAFLRMGGKNRHTGATKQNSKSSRSHAIFTVHCHVRNSERETVGKLNLVDLAGSESVRKTGNHGSRFHEGVNINKGLLSIGRVMTALSTNSSYIPYRQSIITTILQDSLNKKNYISLIACVSANPEDASETLQTLEFASRVKKLKNKPEVNQVVQQYKKENPDLFVRGMTPVKRSLLTCMNETPFKKSRVCLPLIQESGDVSNIDSDSAKFSFSPSVSSISSDPLQQNLSPLIRKHMNAMEDSIMKKLEDVIKNTLKRPTRASLKTQDTENCTTPSFSWDKVAKIVRSEILQFSTQTSRATSSPLEQQSSNNFTAKKLLTYSPTPINNTKDSTICSENAVVEAPVIRDAARRVTRRSSRLSRVKGSSAEDGVFKIPAPVVKRPNGKTTKKGSALQLKQSPETVRNIGNSQTRRSVRLQIKHQSPNLDVDEGCSVCNKSKKCDSTDSPMSRHTRKVLGILNNGNSKQIQTLHTISTKTADQIILFRKLKGRFTSASELAELPSWRKNKYNKFVSENFLRENLTD